MSGQLLCLLLSRYIFNNKKSYRVFQGSEGLGFKREEESVEGRDQASKEIVTKEEEKTC